MDDGPRDLPAMALRTTIAVAAAVGGRLPPEAAGRLAVIGGTLEWALRPRKRRILAANLAHVKGYDQRHPWVRRAVRDEIRNEARRSADFLWSVAFPEQVHGACRIEGREHLAGALEDGHGAILASPHLGGWEVVLPAVSLLDGAEVSAIVDDDWIAHAVAGIRRRAGVRIVPVSGPPFAAARTLRAGGVVAVLPDIVKPGVHTVEVRMLDGRIRLPTGTARLARIARAPIVPAAVLPLDQRAWLVRMEPPITAPAPGSGEAGELAVMQALADRWSVLLRDHPTQWAAVEPLPWVDG